MSVFYPLSFFELVDSESKKLCWVLSLGKKLDENETVFFAYHFEVTILVGRSIGGS